MAFCVGKVAGDAAAGGGYCRPGEPGVGPAQAAARARLGGYRRLGAVFGPAAWVRCGAFWWVGARLVTQVGPPRRGGAAQRRGGNACEYVEHAAPHRGAGCRRQAGGPRSSTTGGAPRNMLTPRRARQTNATISALRHGYSPCQNYGNFPFAWQRFPAWMRGFAFGVGVGFRPYAPNRPGSDVTRAVRFRPVGGFRAGACERSELPHASPAERQRSSTLVLGSWLAERSGAQRSYSDV